MRSPFTYVWTHAAPLRERDGLVEYFWFLWSIIASSWSIDQTCLIICSRMRDPKSYILYLKTQASLTGSACVIIRFPMFCIFVCFRSLLRVSSWNWVISSVFLGPPCRHESEQKKREGRLYVYSCLFFAGNQKRALSFHQDLNGDTSSGE